MTWMAKLYETYEAGMQLDLPDQDELMPISHTLQNAHIKITIDGNGNFERAEILEKTQIVLPATEKSAGRSSGEAPHPLADKIQYIAKDYPFYGGKKHAYFDGYLKQLTDWCNSPYTNTKIEAIKVYVEKGTVVKDLIENNIFHVDNNNDLLLSWPKDNKNDAPLIFKVLPKENGKLDQGNALVCWNVEIKGDALSETWKDDSIQKSWVAYNLSNAGKTGLCYITGKQETLAVNHPAKLRHTGDKAKLISSNDMSGYTFRGRFTDNNKSIENDGAQSVGIAYEVTQKAHNALRWLISRQGFRNGDQVVVTWAVSGKEIPQPMEGTWDFVSNDSSETLMPAEAIDNQINHARDLGQSFSTSLKKYMAGYRAKLETTDNIVIMGLDSATPGRMGVTYYQELFPDEYIDRISQWHKDFAWPQRYTTEEDVGKTKPVKKTIWPISAPPPKAIWEAIYGIHLNDSLKKNTIERILPCIVESRPFPLDLVLKAVQKATNRNSYKNDEQWLWEKHLCIACALYKGYSQRTPDNTKRRNYAMSLELDRKTRDYLYGRLLAVAEKIEEMAMIVAKEKPRTTNASRLMQRFVDYPSATWLLISKAIVPYQQRLKSKIPPLEEGYKRLLDEISDAFEIDDFNSADKLSGEYLLGFHSQRKWLREYKLKEGKWVLKENNNQDNESEI